MHKRNLKIIAFLLSFLLIFQQSGFTQVAAELNIAAHLATLQSNIVQDRFRPLHLRYLSYDTQANKFKLLLDKGSLKELNNQLIENTTKDLLKYFFIGISLPNDSFWVNLRPDSPDNIIDDYLTQTDIGKIMLEADLQLKKDTAKATSPETPEGKLYWDKLYQKAEELFGSQDIEIPTLTRPWIVPGEIIIRETIDSAYIYKATLKVMLEQDYLKNSATYNFKDPRLKALNEYSSQLIRERIIPKLTKEINSAKCYAPLRQVYYSLILAQWFKARFYGKGGLHSSSINKRNLTNLTPKLSWSKETYFKAYQKSFKDGEYNIQQPIYTLYGQSIRSYFSGGIQLMPKPEELAPFGEPKRGSSPISSLVASSSPVARDNEIAMSVSGTLQTGGAGIQVASLSIRTVTASFSSSPMAGDTTERVMSFWLSMQHDYAEEIKFVTARGKYYDESIGRERDYTTEHLAEVINDLWVVFGEDTRRIFQRDKVEIANILSPLLGGGNAGVLRAEDIRDIMGVNRDMERILRSVFRDNPEGIIKFAYTIKYRGLERLKRAVGLVGVKWVEHALKSNTSQRTEKYLDIFDSADTDTTMFDKALEDIFDELLKTFFQGVFGLSDEFIARLRKDRKIESYQTRVKKELQAAIAIHKQSQENIVLLERLKTLRAQADVVSEQLKQGAFPSSDLSVLISGIKTIIPETARYADLRSSISELESLVNREINAPQQSVFSEARSSAERLVSQIRSDISFIFTRLYDPSNPLELFVEYAGLHSRDEGGQILVDAKDMREARRIVVAEFAHRIVFELSQHKSTPQAMRRLNKDQDSGIHEAYDEIVQSLYLEQKRSDTEQFQGRKKQISVQEVMAIYRQKLQEIRRSSSEEGQGALAHAQGEAIVETLRDLYGSNWAVWGRMKRALYDETFWFDSIEGFLTTIISFDERNNPASVAQSVSSPVPQEKNNQDLANQENEVGRFLSLVPENTYTPHFFNGNAIRIRKNKDNTIIVDSLDKENQVYGTQEEIIPSDIQHVVDVLRSGRVTEDRAKVFLLPRMPNNSILQQLTEELPFEIALTVLRNGQVILHIGDEGKVGGLLDYLLNTPVLAAAALADIHSHPPETRHRVYNYLEGEDVDVSQDSAEFVYGLRPSSNDLQVCGPGTNAILTRSGIVVFRLHPGLPNKYKRLLVKINEGPQGDSEEESVYYFAVTNKIHDFLVNAMLTNPASNIKEKSKEWSALFGIYIETIEWEKIGDRNIIDVLDEADQMLKKKAEQNALEKILSNIKNINPPLSDSAKYEQVKQEVDRLEKQMKAIQEEISLTNALNDQSRMQEELDGLAKESQKMAVKFTSMSRYTQGTSANTALIASIQDWIEKVVCPLNDRLPSDINPLSPDRPMAVSSSSGSPVAELSKPISSLVTASPDKKGGIDFRSLPIVTQAIGNLSANVNAQAINRLSALNLNQELQNIQHMISLGFTPSAERIKEYIQASSLKEDSIQDLDKIILCISDILRQEEESLHSTEPVLKDVLVLLESGISQAELKAIFTGIRS